MFNAKRTALFVAISAMALAANEASAGCKYISGTYMCASWIKGSEICNIKVTGLPADGPEGGVQCEVNSFDFDGTLTGDLLCSATPGGSSADCRHTYNGVGKGHTTNADNPGHAGDCEVTRNFTTPTTGPGALSLPLTEFNDSVFANGKGTVLASLEVDIPVSQGDALCASLGGLPYFASFTANKFRGSAIFCSDWFDLPDGESCIQYDQICTSNGNGNSYNCVDAPTD